MQLNKIKPASGAKHSKKRVGRGIGCGLGKTAGRGHKGQKARAGGFHKVGFEGGQMPLQRRLPKRGFVSPIKKDTAQVRLSDLQSFEGDVVDLASLKAAGVIPHLARKAKVILSGEIQRKISLKGIQISAGARAAIEAAGGSVELPEVKVVPGKKADRNAAREEKAAARLEKAGAGGEEATPRAGKTGRAAKAGAGADKAAAPGGKAATGAKAAAGGDKPAAASEKAE